MSSKRTSPRRAAKTKSGSETPAVTNTPDERPSLWIIAGANGSGKTTAYREARLEDPLGSVWIINPDALSARIVSVENLLPAEANLEAVVRIERWLETSIESHQTVGVETVLSTPKYRRLVEAARRRGFRVNLVYVVLNNVELNIQRVAARVAKGGHHVPEGKIRERRTRSFQQLPWFLQNCDRALIYDNSGAEPALVFSFHLDTASLHGPLFPELRDAIVSGLPELGSAITALASDD